MGPENCWVIDAANGKKYFLEMKLTVPETKRKQEFHDQYWHGTIELLKAEIPLK